MQRRAVSEGQLEGRTKEEAVIEKDRLKPVRGGFDGIKLERAGGRSHWGKLRASFFRLQPIQTALEALHCAHEPSLNAL